MSPEATRLAPRPGSRLAPEQAGRIAWWCRERLRRGLAPLTDGAIEVEDGWGRWRVGDGARPAVRIEVHSARFYRDVVFGGGIAAARAHTHRVWDCDDLTALFSLLLRNPRLMDAMEGGPALLANAAEWIGHRWRRNSRTGSRRNIHAHYDLGNDFFALFLDETMTYSCGIFPRASSDMREASIEKLDRICRKLDIGPHDHVLEIGCGWGSFAIHAASRYGCRVTAVTLSRAQHEEARRRVEARGLADRVEVVLTDYRDLGGEFEGGFDKLVSIEMIEAVGHEYLPEFFARCASLLRPDGAMMLQAITMPDQRYRRYLRSSDFIRACVFPGSCVPSLSAMQAAVRDATDLKLVHLEDLAPHYARTLRTWRDTLERKAETARALGYEEELLRLWRYYLCYCEAGFAERHTGLVQMLLDKPARRAAPVLGVLHPKARDDGEPTSESLHPKARHDAAPDSARRGPL